MSLSSKSVSSELDDGSQGALTISDRRLLVDGVNLQYLEAGSGPPLLLLHGHEQSATSWRWVIPVLARTHRVLALSLPGHGESDPAVDGYAPGRDLAPLVADFLDTLGGRTAAPGRELRGRCGGPAPGPGRPDPGAHPDPGRQRRVGP
jgi:Alpha/beta hydrolase family